MIDFQLACAVCGGDLAGVGLAGDCPGCGVGVDRTVSPGLVDVQTMAVGTDVACIGCGYNLRTQQIETHCPECFKPVVESLRPDELRFSDPKWLRRVRRGTTLLLVATLGVAAVCVSFLGIVLATVLFRFGWRPFYGMAVVVILLYAAGIWGVWAATAAPAVRGPTASIVAWLSARILILLPFLLLLFVQPPRSIWIPMWLFIGRWQLSLICLAASCIGTTACLRCVARRGRRPGLVRLSAGLIWLLIIGAGFSGSTVVLSVIMMRPLTAQMAAAQAQAAAAAVQARSLTAAEAESEAPHPTSRATTQPERSTSVLDGDKMTDGPHTTTVMVKTAPSGSVTVTTSTAGGVTVTAPTLNPALSMALNFSHCGAGITYLVCLVIGVIMLFKCRALLTRAVALAPPAR
ncbi:MAG: hypothetical protein IID40_01815 [Planctomycetes bacterium]|nr:hypothetical protein [Planctomycetota bacterium]